MYPYFESFLSYGVMKDIHFKLVHGLVETEMTNGLFQGKF